jgi:hypothetical protein
MKLNRLFIQLVIITVLILPFQNQLKAQIIEDFSDGDFINTPSWSGDDSLFKISTYSSSAWSLQPRLQLNATQAGVAHLRFPNPIANIDSTEWRFWVRISLSSGTSTTNNERVYLTSDSANLLGPLNGYFVMFGDDANSAKDNISLWRQTGLGATQIIDGTIGKITTSKNVSIKVLRDNSGLWKLYSDTIGGTNYQLEGQATDTTYKTSQYAGVYCKFTSSNKTNFYFDDFFIGSIVKDILAPTVTRATVISDTQLELQFSESVNQLTATIASYYSANNGFGSPSLAEIDGVNPSIVRLTFPNSFVHNLAYQLTVSGVTDLVGNILIPQTVPFAYYIPQQWDIVINEIMADPDPAVGLPNVEYVELKNNTALPINLNGWSLVLGTSSKILPDYFLLPDSFVIITAAGSAGNFNPNLAVIGVSSISVTNSGQEISLYTPSQLLVHYINFSDTWYVDNFKKDGGWSLEQIDPMNFCGESENWIASNDLSGGTPGRSNSVFSSSPDIVNPTILRAVVEGNRSVSLYFSESMDGTFLSNPNRFLASLNLGHPITAIASAPTNKSVLLNFADTIVMGQTYTISITDTITDCSGNMILLNSTAQFAIAYPPQPGDVVINEILSNPREGGVDFVELYNRSTKIIDLKQLLLGTLSSGTPSMKTITTEGYLLFPGQYVVLSSNSTPIHQQYTTYAINNFVQMSSFPTYNNDDGVVILTDLNSAEIDKVTYSLDMHYAMLKSTDGVSLERLSAERLSTDKTNWHSAASTVGYATPGYKNSQWSDPNVSDDGITISPEVFTPDNDGMNDVANVSYKFIEPGYRISIWVYNAAGFKVKQLVNNDLASLDGTYSWDGTTENNLKASSGIYLFYIEIWNLNGTVKRYKKPITIGVKFE